MGSMDSDLVRKAEAILASAKIYTGERSQRYALMKQVDLLYQELEDPMDAMLRQWTFVGSPFNPKAFLQSSIILILKPW